MIQALCRTLEREAGARRHLRALQLESKWGKQQTSKAPRSSSVLRAKPEDPSSREGQSEP